MQLGKLAKAASLLTGTVLALFGVLFLVVAAIGDFNQGRLVAIVMGSILLFAALPPLAYPFSARLAKLLLVLLLFASAAGLLWLVFRPAVPVARPGIYQAGAIAFAVLLLARVGLGLRRNRSGLGA
jgi:hypothetical protein